jgi:hypothetical protein
LVLSKKLFREKLICDGTFHIRLPYNVTIPNTGHMIDKVEILRNFHDHAVVITLSNMKKSLIGRIVDDSPVDHCVVVRDPDLIEYYETKKESLMQRVYFSDMKSIDYQ